MKKRKICIVTGTRAEYGLLYWLMKEIHRDEELELQIIATGMHLSPEFGLTYKFIEEDGFSINEKVEMLLSSDTSVGIAKSIGLGVIGFADSFDRLKPDLLVILGDRFEILAAAQAALVSKIPIAHLCGGDTTEGAYDEAIRHSITKMSHLHFVTNEQSGQRVIQLGENPKNVYNVGNPGLDHIKRLKLLSKPELEDYLDFKFLKKNILVTFHPSTLDLQSPRDQFQKLLSAIDKLSNEIQLGVIFTKPNADNDGRILIQMIDDYCSKRDYAKAYTSLGQLRYLSTIQYVDAVVGNSSSGLLEVPTFNKPTVNIGDRQKGRLKSASVLNCEVKCEAILNAIKKSFTMDCDNIENPYGDGNSSKRIYKKIKEIRQYSSLLQKHFHEVGI